MKLLTPIRRFGNNKVVISQNYGEVKYSKWYKDRGIKMPFHNGIDLVLSGGNIDTYGAEAVACFDGQVIKTFWGGKMNSHGNGITIRSKPVYENGIGKMYEALYWHLSELKSPFASEIGVGSCIGYIGNSGDVRPAPSFINPWAGCHLHFGVLEYKNTGDGWFVENKDNGVNGYIDPLPLITDLQGFEGKDTGVSKDLAPVRYFINKLIV
jgi:murein DD-endopeptidase MepM/ murein hydrolase activator NlpD